MDFDAISSGSVFDIEEVVCVISLQTMYSFKSYKQLRIRAIVVKLKTENIGEIRTREP